MRRTVITGLGTVCPLGLDVKNFWHGLLHGRSGVALVENLDTSPFKVKFGGEVKNFDPEQYLEPKTARRLDRLRAVRSDRRHGRGQGERRGL